MNSKKKSGTTRYTQYLIVSLWGEKEKKITKKFRYSVIVGATLASVSLPNRVGNMADAFGERRCNGREVLAIEIMLDEAKYSQMCYSAK